MRKYVIGVAIGIIFLVYSLVIRNHHGRVIIPSTPSKTTTSSTPASSTGSSTANSSTANSSTANTSTTTYKDGTFTGNVANAYYGNIQVAAVISGGKITNVNFLQHPNDNPTSSYINQQADPYLKQEAIQAQSSNVNIVTGATFSSEAFIQSLANALSQAKN
ncbi:MAG: FMN-binding protein [Candidatus Saccharimonadales bacterium]